jgi:hypothetical protein
VVREPANPQPVAAYTRLQTGDTDAQSSPAGLAHVAAEPDAATAEDTEGNANDEKGSGKANGNGKDKGNGKDNGDGGGKGNGKKDD